MRFSVIALVATVAAVANAQTDYYPFQPNGACVKSCLLTVGKDMDPKFTDEPTDPYFISSLYYAHERGTPKYIAYMTKTGPCIAKCPQAEQDLYNKDYPPKNDWYLAHKNGGAATSSGAASPSATSSGAVTNGTATTSASAKSTNAGSGAGSLAASGLVGAVALLSAAALF
ncbi:hypothetical protein BGZ46_007268 [Entomortierella lignicola]|nr:hypothetical protein BGZ46_007268 [Entomortierella lignicola]